MFGVESMLIDSHIMMRDTRELTVISMLVNNNTYIKLYTIVGVGDEYFGENRIWFWISEIRGILGWRLVQNYSSCQKLRCGER